MIQTIGFTYYADPPGPKVNDILDLAKYELSDEAFDLFSRVICSVREQPDRINRNAEWASDLDWHYWGSREDSLMFRQIDWRTVKSFEPVVVASDLPEETIENVVYELLQIQIDVHKKYSSYEELGSIFSDIGYHRLDDGGRLLIFALVQDITNDGYIVFK